jgi:hypothetical protein
MFVVVLSWALLVFMVVTIMGFVGVPNDCSQGFYWCSWSLFSQALLVFLIVALVGFIGVLGHCFHGLYQHLW